MSWTLIEPCAGSAAMTCHLFGMRRQLFPYQGSKWSLRHQYASLFAELGFSGRPTLSILSDLTPIAEAVALTLRDSKRVLPLLELIVEEGTPDGIHYDGPKVLFEALQNQKVPDDKYDMTVEFLWLQRMAFSGKAVGVKRGKWNSPGLNVTSAYGTPATDRFGEVKPLGDGLLDVVRSISLPKPVVGFRGTYEPGSHAKRALVFFDPNYQGTTPYPCGGFSRDEAIDYAMECYEAGHSVIYCEAEPIGPLIDRGWRSKCIQEGNGNSRSRMQSRAKKKGCRGYEYVTYAVK